MSKELEPTSLEHDNIKYKLIRDLAESGLTQSALALQYGVSASAISQFKKKHNPAIMAYSASLPDPMEKYWVADKSKRIESLQADVELLDSQEDVDAIKVKLAIFKAIEESLGQAPAKVNIQLTKQVNYSIEGVDLEDLR